MSNRWNDLLPAVTQSADETVEIGAKIAGRLRPGDVVALYGELGSGKTQLAKGICRHFGIPVSHVTSPTFTIVNEYSGGRLSVYHIDAYRITRIEELTEMGFESYLDPAAVCIVEWPENIEPALPDDAVAFHLSHQKDDRRLIAWRSPSDDPA